MEYAWKKPEGEASAKKKRHRGGKKRKKGAAAEQPAADLDNMMEGGSENAELFVKYLKGLMPKKTRKPPLLSGHTVTVGVNYQRTHFNEMLYLVQMITNAGGRYTLSTREADTLYVWEDAENDPRYEIAKEMGEEIEILPIKNLFDLLETSDMRLSRKPKMDLSAFEENADDEAAEPVAAQ